MRKFKVTFVMASGAIFKVRFNKFESSLLTGTKGNRTVSHSGGPTGFTIDIDEVQAIVIKKMWSWNMLKFC